MALFIIFSTNVFASADTAYVLAYSIIMLTTDLHSPQVMLQRGVVLMGGGSKRGGNIYNYL